MIQKGNVNHEMSAHRSGKQWVVQKSVIMVFLVGILVGGGLVGGTFFMMPHLLPILTASDLRSALKQHSYELEGMSVHAENIDDVDVPTVSDIRDELEGMSVHANNLEEGNCATEEDVRLAVMLYCN